MSKPDYDKLKKKWYAKLAKEGFKDIESDEDSLKTYSNIFAQKHSPEQTLAKIEYYRMAEHFLNEYKFASKLDQIIWEYHSNGISMRNIAKLLKQARVARTNRTDVWKLVKRLRFKMYEMYVRNAEFYYDR